MGCLNVRFSNAWWDVLDDYVMYNYDVRMIDYGDKVYRSFEDHPWGMFYVHYDMSFYQDFSREFLNIVLDDTRRELEAAKRKIEIAGSGKDGKIKKYFRYIMKMLYLHK